LAPSSNSTKLGQENGVIADPHPRETHQISLAKDKLLDSYNWNPTIGCLSTLELTTRQESCNRLICLSLNVLTAGGGKNFAGYMVVVDTQLFKVPSCRKEAILQKK